VPGTTDYLPAKEAELVTWSNHFASLLTAGTGDNYGLTALQTAAFDNLNTAWVDAYNIANGNDTRTPSSIVAKDNAKRAMIENARELARIIQANPGVTDQEKSDLGLTVRDTEPSPVPAPAYAPGISIVSAIGTQVEIRLHDVQNPENVRGKPAGVAGAAVLTAFGSAPPLLSDPSAWTWQGNTSRTITMIDFAGQPSGTTAWITAVWYNAKAQTGPPTQPISVQIPGQLQASQGEGLQFPEELNEAA